VTIVGAGVIGCAMARELSAAGHQVFVLEKNPGVTQGENQSSRNSGVIHAGLYYDPETRPLKASLCARGAAMLYDFLEKYDLPHLRCGKMVVATDGAQLPVLQMYQDRAEANGVKTRLITREEASNLEPMVHSTGALLVPDSGIIDPTAYLHQLYALASGHGAEFLTSTTLAGATLRDDGIELTVRYRDGAEDNFLTGWLVNCAGLYADQVARMINPESTYHIDPMRGEAARFYRTKRPELWVRSMNVYPTPYQVVLPGGAYWTVGVHLTPTLEQMPNGKWGPGPVVTVGPLNFGANGREDYAGQMRPMEDFHREVVSYFPGLRPEDLEPHQVGVQARLAGHQDWVVTTDPACPRCLHFLGIDSPGLTSSLALAQYGRELMEG